MRDFVGGPGLDAFLATFVLAAAVILIARSLTRHLRSVQVDAGQPPGPAVQQSASAVDGTEAPDATLRLEDHQRDGNEVAGETGDRQ